MQQLPAAALSCCHCEVARFCHYSHKTKEKPVLADFLWQPAPVQATRIIAMMDDLLLVMKYLQVATFVFSHI